MEDLDTYRTIGAHEARLIELERWRVSFEAKLDRRFEMIEESLGEIKDAVTGAKGGWRAIAWVAGISGTVAAGFGALYHFFVGR